MITPILRHEIKTIIRNPKVWYSIATLQILLAVIFNWLITNFLKNQAVTQAMHYGITEEVIHPYYAWFALIILALLPMAATQMLTAEKVRGTIINYYCAPVDALQVLLGKYFAMLTILCLLFGMISIMPMSIILSGHIDWGQYVATLLGVYLMLAASCAISLCVAAFMANIVRANLLIFITLLAFIMLEWAAQYGGRNAMFLQTFGLLKPMKEFLAGIITMRNGAYYLFLIFSYVWLGSWAYQRRWQT